MTATLISSQSYRDEARIEARGAARDYTVTVVTLPGEPYAAVIDGHHSLTAAIEDGVEPELIECTDSDTLYGLETDVESWLDRHAVDSDWRIVNMSTGRYGSEEPW